MDEYESSSSDEELCLMALGVIVAAKTKNEENEECGGEKSTKIGKLFPRW